MLEKTIEEDIKDFLFSINSITGHYVYFKKNHGSAFTKKGIPDIDGCFMGKYFSIEGKAKGKLNTQSEAQKVHMNNIIKSGGNYLLTDNLHDVIAFMIKIHEENCNEKCFDNITYWKQ